MGNNYANRLTMLATALDEEKWNKWTTEFGFLIMKTFGCGTMVGLFIGLFIGGIMGLVVTLKLWNIM